MSDATPGTSPSTPGTPRPRAAPRTPGAAPETSSDSDIVARISAAVHAPFAEVWRRYEAEAWLPIRRALEGVADAHRRALSAVNGRQDAREALARYRELVSDDVVEPLRAALAGRAAATVLEESLASAADRARASAAELPALLQAPASRSPSASVSGVGTIRAIKRAAARVLGPVVWRGRERRVPVARLARQHLDQVVLREQANAFRRSQHDRAEWLGRLERAWADWAATVLQPVPSADETVPAADSVADDRRPDGPRAHRAAGEALQAELQALIDDFERAARAAGIIDIGRLDESLAASVAVAGTFAADPPSSRPGPGRQRELAVQWDAWAEGAAARLALYRGLVAMRRDVQEILGELRGDWARTVRVTKEALAEVAAELVRGRERTERLSAEGEVLAPMLEAERQRTDTALARIQGTLPEPDGLFQALTAAVEEAIDGLDAVRERMPATLALHDIPRPGDALRRPAGDPRSVHLREAFLQAFDMLRRERMRAAPSAIREAMSRVGSEVSELREVSGYGYEAAAAEAKDRRHPDAHPTVFAANGLVRAGNKAAAARELLREAVRAAQDKVAAEVDDGSRRLIERVTADRVTAGYLEARTYMTAGLARGWRWAQGLAVQAYARAAVAGSGAWVLLRWFRARLGLGPPLRVASERRDSLARADEYPHALPVVYRRLFSLESVTDARLLAGRDDALAAVAAAWARRESGEARSLVVIASPGVGATSFLNVVASRLSAEEPGGVRRRFTTRVREEARLAGSLAGWLGLGDARDLDSLADRVLEAPADSIPAFAILGATEHLHMRAPGGSRLFERLLTFMSRTESRVFWIAAITSSAWQLVERRASPFVYDIERLTLGELSPEALKHAVLARHRLSGLPLRFAEPHNRRAAFRRRARRLRGAVKQEQLIEADYFQRLHRASQGSPRLALFHWLRSADFATAKGSLLVQPLSSVRSGIGTLDRMQSFALKAILDHGTLTIDEHSEVMRMSGAESLHILRSLEECQVIEKVQGSARYRIRPLMIGAVAAHLRSRNILH